MNGPEDSRRCGFRRAPSAPAAVLDVRAAKAAALAVVRRGGGETECGYFPGLLTCRCSQKGVVWIGHDPDLGSLERVGFFSQRIVAAGSQRFCFGDSRRRTPAPTVLVDELDANGFRHSSVHNVTTRDVPSQFMPQCRRTAIEAHLDGFPRQFVEMRTTRPTPN